MHTRITTLLPLLLLVAVAAAPALAAPSATQPATQPAEDADPLERRITIDIKDKRLDETLMLIRDAIDGEIVINWYALQAIGVAQDIPITLRLRDRPLDMVLDHVLRQAGAGSFEPIGHSLRDGIVYIGTLHELVKENRETRIYDIRWLLSQPVSFPRAPRLAGAGGDPPQGVRLDEAPAVAAPVGTMSREVEVDRIRTLIQSLVGDSTLWIEQQYTMQELDGNLIVKTEPQGHDEVRAILQELHRQRTQQLAVEARLLRMPVAEVDRINRELAGGDLLLDREGADAVEALSTQSKGVEVVATTRLVLTRGQRTYALSGKYAVGDQPVTNLLDRRQLREEVREPGYVLEDDTPPFDLNHALSGASSGGSASESGSGGGIFHPSTASDDAVTPNQRPADPQAPLPVIVSREALLLDVQSDGGADFGRMTLHVRADVVTPQQRPPASKSDEPSELRTYLTRWRTTVHLPDGGGVLLTGSNRGSGDARGDTQELVLFIRARVVATD